MVFFYIIHNLLSLCVIIMVAIKSESEILSEVIKCTQCNLCILGCPMFNGNRYDYLSPRAIIIMLRDYLNGKIEFDDFLARLLYLCNLCGSCDLRCPARIDITDIVFSFRKRIFESKK